MHILKKYLLTILTISLCLFACFMPAEAIPSVSIIGLDKIVHFAMFLMMCSTFLIEYLFEHNYLPSYIPVLLVFTLFGFSTEYAQDLLTHSRHYDLMDFIANCIGTLTALFFIHILYKYLPATKNKLFKLMHYFK